jgi:hypothetical protein
MLIYDLNLEFSVTLSKLLLRQKWIIFVLGKVSLTKGDVLGAY